MGSWVRPPFSPTSFFIADRDKCPHKDASSPKCFIARRSSLVEATLTNSRGSLRMFLSLSPLSASRVDRACCPTFSLCGSPSEENMPGWSGLPGVEINSDGKKEQFQWPSAGRSVQAEFARYATDLSLSNAVPKSADLSPSVDEAPTTPSLIFWIKSSFSIRRSG